MINKIHPTETWHDVLYLIKKLGPGFHGTYMGSFYLQSIFQGNCHYQEMPALCNSRPKSIRLFWDYNNSSFELSCLTQEENYAIFSDKKECLEEYRRLVGEK